MDADSDQFLLLLLSEFEQNLLLLQRDVQKYDLSTIIKEMAEEEVSQSFTTCVLNESQTNGNH